MVVTTVTWTITLYYYMLPPGSNYFLYLERVHESTRQSRYMSSHRFQWNFASLKGLPQNPKRQAGFCFGFFRGEIDHPPVFLGFHRGNRFKIGKIYKALTAMVSNQLLWGFAHIFLHPKLMFTASISQFYGRLANQQRQINDCVFRLSIHPNIWQLWSQISPLARKLQH